MALISVLLPYRDAAGTIGEALESVLAQRGLATGADAGVEVIVVDDASRDDGPAIVAAWAARDQRVRAIAGSPNGEARGIVAMLTIARAAARGEWLARMDHDDISHPDRFAAQLDTIASMPGVAAIGTQVEAFPADAIGPGMRAYVAWQNSLTTPAEHARDLFVEAPLCHPSVMLRASALDAVGGWREETWAEDYDLWLRLDAAGFGLAKVPRPLLEWRHTPGRMTFSSPTCAHDRIVAAKAHYLAPKLRAFGRPIAIWGAGPTGRRTARALEAQGVRPELFVDIDPKKIGRTARGAPIRDPSAVSPDRHAVVVAVGGEENRVILRARLGTAGFVEGADFICVA